MAVDNTQTVVGYLIADVVDGCGHVEQVSVDPKFRGHRIGRSLIEACSDWACQQNLPVLTLTTYREVPWNGPYYERLGFSYLAQQTPGLKRIRQSEVEAGLDAWPRTCMHRSVNPSITDTSL
ncbi:GNAT family N-acetyltransferase [Gordonia sp. (in: high G+C Gram-positive bacteria)]|uniref:GNAT family N-acetyltransferase n=1 Tax=Gordonia sp. (in: high G+C Gram-positive bacteria) TaxID=84139 RepID=UPI003C775A99